MPALLLAHMAYDGRDTSTVTAAAPGWRKAAWAKHGRQHLFWMQKLGARSGATLEAMQVLAGSADAHACLTVAVGIAIHLYIGGRYLADKTAAILRAPIADYDSSYAPYLVPVCKDVDQLRAMHEETSVGPGRSGVFLGNPCAPGGVLLDIALSAGVRPGWPGVTRQVLDVLQLRVDQRESSTYNDMAPS